jgi:hypothetical protein
MNIIFAPSMRYCSFALLVCLSLAANGAADSPDGKPAAKPSAQAEKTTATKAAATKAAATDGEATTQASNAPATTTSGKTTTSKPKYPSYSEFLEGAQTIDGMIRLHRKDVRLYAELTSGDLNKDFIVLISIARGIAQRQLLGGMSWGFGDDWIWQFRKIDDRIQVVRRNVRFRAAKGTPQERAVHLSYTDSVMFSLPIATRSPSGAYVVDFTPIFMSDLPQISAVLRGFAFSQDKSSWASTKGFKDNIEIQVAATYASSGNERLDTVADSRSVTINVHYSISRLPETGYEPRLADDRVGYFVTVVKDFTKATDHERFVRYINRWDLRKADASAEVSPPKKPIIFWLEKTIPYKYRAPIREGITEWNKAFEKACFVNAIEVRQQPDDADWDPEDINYNTFRWITANAGMAMGPSRVNPMTGQILDADIIFDADFLESWKDRYETENPDGATASAAGHTGSNPPEAWELSPDPHRHGHSYLCDCAQGMARQLAFGALALESGDKPASKETIERLIMDGIKSVAIHEVGHTMGLRHNFKASAFLSLADMANPKKTDKYGIAASEMDYLPMNVAPKGQKQGPYFDTMIGPYDYWAIEYGYKAFSGGPEGELSHLRKIASRSAEPALRYGTDEDARPSDPDPLCIRFDLGDDPVEFAKRQVRLINQIMPDLVERVVGKGEGYQQARRSFSLLLTEYGRAMGFVARVVGGVYVYRDHKGEPNAQPPFVVAEAQQQRAAMELLHEQVFGEEALQFSPKLYNYLSPSYWEHWGAEVPSRVDFAVVETMFGLQQHVLSHLLSTLTLSRLIDNELKVPANEDAFTAAEMLEKLTAAIFSETQKLQSGDYTARKPAINTLRRNLQRRYVEILADIAMGNAPAPEDCQSVAVAELEALEARIKQVQAGKAQLDTYTRAHLSELVGLIRKVLDARLQLHRP